MASMSDAVVPVVSSLQQVVGALLFGADRPLTVDDIYKCLKNVAESDGESNETARLFGEISPREINEVLLSIGKELQRLELGIELAVVNGSYRYQTDPSCGAWLRNLLKRDRPNRLSRPALETLAIIAYRQPISKSEMEAVRGVMVDHIIKSLMELHLIRIVGRSELPGRPFLYGTTATFLEHFGLKSLAEVNEVDPTLQRSRPSERRAVHTKPKERVEQGGETPLL